MKVIYRRSQFVIGRYYLFKEEEFETIGKYIGYDEATQRHEFEIVKSNKVEEETGRKLFTDTECGYIDDKRLEYIYELSGIEAFKEIL